MVLPRAFFLIGTLALYLRYFWNRPAAVRSAVFYSSTYCNLFGWARCCSINRRPLRVQPAISIYFGTRCCSISRCPHRDPYLLQFQAHRGTLWPIFIGFLGFTYKPVVSQHPFKNPGVPLLQLTLPLDLVYIPLLCWLGCTGCIAPPVTLHLNVFVDLLHSGRQTWCASRIHH